MLDSSTGYMEKTGVLSCLCWPQELLRLPKGPWLRQRGQNKLSVGKGSDQGSSLGEIPASLSVSCPCPEPWVP